MSRGLGFGRCCEDGWRAWGSGVGRSGVLIRAPQGQEPLCGLSVGQGPSLLLFSTGTELLGGQHNRGQSSPGRTSDSTGSWLAQRPRRPEPGLTAGAGSTHCSGRVRPPSCPLHPAVPPRLPLVACDTREVTVNKELAHLHCSQRHYERLN